MLIGIAFGILLSGLILFIAKFPRGEPIEILPPATPKALTFYITGAIKTPGVYQLPPESRYADAVKIAGGFSEDANQTVINLAAQIREGQKILIPTLGSQDSSVQKGSSVKSFSEDIPLNINDASIEDLQSLPGIGETKAKAILEYREKSGAFSSVEELLKVPGIGPSIFNEIKYIITVQ